MLEAVSKRDYINKDKKNKYITQKRKNKYSVNIQVYSEQGIFFYLPCKYSFKRNI